MQSFLSKNRKHKEIKLSVAMIKELAEEDKRSEESDVSHILNQLLQLDTVLNTEPINNVKVANTLPLVR
jgi:hypothetical protein